MNAPELTAPIRTLREIRPQFVAQPVADRLRRWFQGNEPYFDLFVQENNGAPEWFQITYRGKSLTWEHPDYIWTGETHEMEYDPQHYPAKKPITPDANINTEFLETMIGILRQQQDEPVFGVLIRLLEQSRRGV